jgi:release factor glutamine methyltransferase
MDGSLSLATIVSALEDAGCVAAAEEADELVAAARHNGHLDEMVSRRVTGEPLAWITGSVVFCHLRVAVEPGTYVPRWQSERLARRAAELLPPEGTGVDLCTGSGAIAMVMRAGRPGARVVGTEIDPLAARSARRQGVEVYEGRLCEPLPGELAGQVDVMTGVLPYVPSDALHLLPRDVQAFEPRRALDGGRHGLALVSEAVATSPRWLKHGGWLLLEIGPDQVKDTTTLFGQAGFVDLELLEDGDGDVRGLAGRLL